MPKLEWGREQIRRRILKDGYEVQPPEYVSRREPRDPVAEASAVKSKARAYGVVPFLRAFHALKLRVDEVLTSGIPLTLESLESLRMAVGKGQHEDEARAQEETHRRPDALEIVKRSYLQLEERFQTVCNTLPTQPARQAPTSVRNATQGRKTSGQRVIGKLKSIRSRPDVVVVVKRNDLQGSMTDREFLRHVVALSEQVMVVGIEGRRRRSVKKLSRNLEEYLVALRGIWGGSIDLSVRNDLALVQAAVAFLKSSLGVRSED